MWPIPKRNMTFKCSGSVSDVAGRIRNFRHHMYREWWDTPECDPNTGAPVCVRFQFIPENTHQKYRSTFFPIVTGVLTAEGQGTRLKLIMRCDLYTELMLWIWLVLGAWCLVGAIQKLVADPEVATINYFVMVVVMLLGVFSLNWYQFFRESENILKALRKYI